MVMFNRKFEPEEKKIIHGAGQDLQSFKEYSDAVGKCKPAIYMTYVKINEIEKWSQRILSEIDEVSIQFLQIGLHLRKKYDDNIYESQCAEIANGDYDHEINFFCETLKKISIPTFLRIGYEFNEPNKYDSISFVSAWKHIVGKLREFNVNNVATVWCSCPAFSKNIDEIMDFYPGDELVDWFGIDLFGVNNFKNSNNILTEEFIRKAEFHHKPVMVGECSAIRTNFSDDLKAWDNWFAPFFEWLYQHPIVKAFCYINWNWEKQKDKWKEWGDCRIQINENLRKRYVQELNKDLFVNCNSDPPKNIKPEKILYDNQEAIQEKIISLLQKDIPLNSEAIIFGSLAELKFGRYTEKYNGHEGSDIDVIIFIKNELIPKHWKFLNVSKGWWDLYRGIKIEINGFIHKTDILVVKTGFENFARQRIIDNHWKTIKIMSGEL